METIEYSYELLVRGKPGGISGAHQIKAYEVRDDAGNLVHQGTGTAMPLTIGGEEWATAVGQSLNDALAELEAVKTERDTALVMASQATAERDLALERANTAEAAAAASLARVAELEVQLVALQATTE